MNQPTVSAANSLEAQIRACCLTLDDKKAENLKVLYMGEASSLTDYFIIATGTSQPHLRAIRIAIEDTMQKLNATIIGVDSDPYSGWVVVDAGCFMIHIFTRATRDIYKLEMLWSDAKDVTEAMLAPEPSPEVAKPVKRKVAAKVTKPTVATAKSAPKAKAPKKVVAKTPKPAKPAAKKPAAKAKTKKTVAE